MTQAKKTINCDNREKTSVFVKATNFDRSASMREERKREREKEREEEKREKFVVDEPRSHAGLHRIVRRDL